MRLLIVLCAALAAIPAAAQIRPIPRASGSQDLDVSPVAPRQQPTPFNTNQTGQIAGSSVGQVGQRQSSGSAAAEAGIMPMARISNRIQNRVQSRIRNRIDRNYDPQANASDPFVVAEDQARAGGRPR